MKILSRILGEVGPSKNALKTYDELVATIDNMSREVKAMRAVFLNGGEINIDQLRQYEISEGGNLIPYPMGTYTIGYRIPCPLPDGVMFHCVFSPPKGKTAHFGIHNHPDAIEHTWQMSGTAYCRGEKLPPISMSTFQPGEWHDYETKEQGTAIVLFLPA